MNAINKIESVYLARCADIRGKLDRLNKLADDHFNHKQDNINWGHVGDLDRVNQTLDELLVIFDN